MNKLDINTGDIFRSLKIIRELDKKGLYRVFLVECIDCGKIFPRFLNGITNSKNKGNGCTCGRGPKKHWKTYRENEKKLYSIYGSIKQRCNENNKNHRSWKYYGGRGIKCEWNNFEDFYNEMSDTYVPGLSIDRIDVNGNYCKDNCRWTDIITQNNNRKNVLKDCNGLSITEYLRYKGYSENDIKYGTSIKHIYKITKEEVEFRIKNKRNKIHSS